MTTTYRIDEANTLAVISLSGDLTAEEFAACAAAMAADPAFHRDMSRLVIARGVTSFPEGSVIQTVAHTVRDRAHSYGARYGIVVDSPLAMGMMNMIMGQAGMMDRYEFFDTEQEAVEWLLSDRAHNGAAERRT
ncbi:MAG TPA: STAS/SEC14 domain-containing protein [Gemmatimonadaceae bacterium]